MKPILTALALAAVAMAAPAFAADIGVSISIGEPGYYGEIQLGNYGRPTLLRSRPITIERSRYGAAREPLYVRVPATQSRDWKRYCGKYNACGRPVYFVRDDWYNNVYAPHYRNDHHGGRDDRDNRDNRDDRRDNDDRHDRDDRDRGGR